MKKIAWLLTIVLLTLSFAQALAAPGDAQLFYGQRDGDNYTYVEHFANTDQYLYFLAYGSNIKNYALMRYDWATGEYAQVADNLPATYYHEKEDFERSAKDQTPEQVLSKFCAYEGELYSFNMLTGAIYHLVLEDKSIRFDKLFDVDVSGYTVDQGDYVSVAQIYTFMKTEDAFVLSTYNYETDPHYALALYDAATGEKQAVQSAMLNDIVPYRDGRMLSIVYDPDNSYDEVNNRMLPREIHSVDLKTGASQKMYEIGDSSRALQYDAATDMIYYVDGSKLMSIASDGNPQVCAYMPCDSYSINASALHGSLFAAASYNGLFIKNTDIAYLPTTIVSVYGHYADSKDASFLNAYPEAAINYTTDYFNSIEELTRAMSASDEIDVVSLYSGSEPGLSALIDKGYCQDLSGYPALMEAVNNMHPYIKDYVTKDGKLYAIPMQVNQSGYQLNKNILAETGLSENELPTNFIELCDFITLWNDELYEDFPNYLPMSAYGETKRQLLNQALNSYAIYYQSIGQDISYNTDIFRSLLKAIDNMQTDLLDSTEEDDSMMWERQPLLEEYGSPVDLSSPTPAEGNRYAKPWPISLTSDTPVLYDTYVNYMIISPNSDCKDVAAAYIANLVANLEIYSRSTIDATITESIENPYFKQNLTYWQEALDDCTQKLETCDESERKDYESRIKSYQDLLDNPDDYRYQVTTQAIEYYKNNIVDKCVITNPNPLYGNNYEQFQPIISRYSQGTITSDQFIMELDKKMQMIILESK